MKTVVEFRSSSFPAYEGEEEQINPGIWGRRLAEYLVEKLASHGLATARMHPEDWGWYVPLRMDGRDLGVCCGHQSGDEDQFMCFTDPARPIVRKLFKRVDLTPQLTLLTGVLQEVLAADPGIRELEWSEPAM